MKNLIHGGEFSPLEKLMWVSPDFFWKRIIKKMILDPTNPNKGVIDASPFLDIRKVGLETKKGVRDRIVIEVKQSEFKDNIERNIVIHSLFSNMDFYKQKVREFKYSLGYHASHDMGDNLFEGSIYFPEKGVILPYNENYINIFLQIETFQEIWMACYGQFNKNYEDTKEACMAFSFASIQKIFIEK